MHVLLCSGKPDEEKAELCGKKTFLPLPWDGELMLMAAVALICV